MNETTLTTALSVLPTQDSGRARVARFFAVSGLALMLGCAAACAGVTPVSIRDGGALVLTGRAVASRDSNVFLSSPKSEPGTISIFSPGLSLELGKRGTTTARVSLREDLLFHANQSDASASLASPVFEGNVPASRADADSPTGLAPSGENAGDVRGDAGALVHLDRSYRALQLEYERSPKTSAGAALSLDGGDFKDPEPGARPGYRFRQSQIPGVADARLNEPLGNVGGRGELAPSAGSSIPLGVASHRFSRASSASLLGFDGSAIASAAPGVSGTVLFSRDFRSPYATGTAVPANAATVHAGYATSEFWPVEGNVRYESTTYFMGRGGDFLNAEMYFSDVPSTLVIVPSGRVLETNHSNDSSAAVERRVVTFSTGLAR